MPTLANYHHFEGRHWETGSVQNVLAYQGITAPHTGQPISEALLLGISGGIVFGYFTFDYAGNDPILALLCRNTFDPMDTMLERLAIPQDIRQTAKPDAGEANLIEALENGTPPIVWADMFTLPYHAIEEKAAAGWWEVNPVVVYGYENGRVYLADRSRCPLEIDAKTFAAARARIKKDKFRLVMLDRPDFSKLSGAVQKGIWQCLSLYTDAPPKGARHNFGLAALEHWIEMLESKRNKQSWTRFFEPGNRMYAALMNAYNWIMLWGTGNGMERDAYADFLGEAAVILEKPALDAAAPLFRESAVAWRDLAVKLLLDDVPLLGETRALMQRDHDLFIDQGNAATNERRALKARLSELKAQARTDFPLNEESAAEFRAMLRDQVGIILKHERAAVEALQAAMG